jgi:uncharacterized membrane protein YeaQ/YmgE (transglycosylase-associated protein family)
MVLAPESIVVWLVIGAIAGWLAGQIVRGYGFGLIGDIAVSIVGAAIGGIVLPRLGIFRFRPSATSSQRLSVR